MVYMADWQIRLRQRALLTAVALAVLLTSPVALGAAPANPCDLNGDGVVDIRDVQVATNMVLGKTPCTANVVGAGVCNLVLVQRITTAALTGSCVTTAPTHSVSLSWTASTSANVRGYNVYRATRTGGPYTKLTSTAVTGTAYTDSSVQAGQTLFYVTTAVDTSNNESAYSNQSQAVVPSP